MQEALFHNTLRRELGLTVLAAFEDADVTDIYTNVDGSVWLDTHSQGRCRVPELEVAPERITRFLNVLATALKVELGNTQLHLDAELPALDFGRARVRGWMPPIVEHPVLIIRKHASQVFSLEELARGGLFPETLLPMLTGLVARGDSILVVGATGSGKTTLLNALLEAHARLDMQERLLVLEDTLELQLRQPDVLRLRTSSGSSSRQGYALRELVKGSLRSAPDRIIVGEVRDASALDLLDAWATGHRGGFGTLHAETVEGAILRLDRLAQRNRVPSQRALIFEAVDWIAVLELDRLGSSKRAGSSAHRRPPGRVLVELARLHAEGEVIESVYRQSEPLDGEPSRPERSALSQTDHSQTDPSRVEESPYVEPPHAAAYPHGATEPVLGCP